MTSLSRSKAAMVAILCLLPMGALADQCQTRIDGEPVTITYHTDDLPGATWRDRLNWRRALGREDSECPATLVLTYLLPDLTATEREVFCANYDPDTRSHSVPAIGRRDATGRCDEPSRTCRFVNATAAEAKALTGLNDRSARDLATGAVTRATHASGAMILSGNAASLGTILTTASTAVGTALASPAILAGAAASVVVVGSAVYLCADEDQTP
jgi:hypothetical protein